MRAARRKARPSAPGTTSKTFRRSTTGTTGRAERRLAHAGVTPRGLVVPYRRIAPAHDTQEHAECRVLCVLRRSASRRRSGILVVVRFVLVIVVDELIRVVVEVMV